MKLKNLTAEEVLNAKFKETHITIEGYLKEAEGDMNAYNNVKYSSESVHIRILKIKNSFITDLENLAKSIEI